MSIKNPYKAEPGDSAIHSDRDLLYIGFNEGVKAANEDWIEWAQSKCPHNHLWNPETKNFEEDTIKLECYQCWKDRKKELEQ